MPQRGDELLASRRAKLERLIQRGVDPFPARFNRTHSTAEAISAFSGAQSATPVKAIVAGRVARIRRMGKASFVDIEDSDGRLQLFVRSDVLGESYGLIDDIDLGDFVGASGDLMRTRAGEISLGVEDLVFLAKALRPPPEKFHGLRDVEQRYRQRYLDLIANKDVHDAMRARSR